MAIDQLLAEGVADVLDVVLAFLLADLGVKNDVEQQVAQLLFDLLGVIFEDGLAQFKGLLDGVCAEALARLHAVPRAFLPQVVHDVEQSAEGLHLFFFRMHENIGGG